MNVTTGLRSEISPGARSRTKFVLWTIGVYGLVFVTLALIDLISGGLEPAGEALRVAVYAVVFTFVVPPLEYRFFRWRARRSAPPGSGTVVPCGVIEWRDGRGRTIGGGLRLPNDGTSPTWQSMAAGDRRQPDLSPDTRRIAGYRTPKGRERWAIGGRLVIVVLTGPNDEETHLCLTARDAATVADRYPTTF